MCSAVVRSMHVCTYVVNTDTVSLLCRQRAVIRFVDYLDLQVCRGISSRDKKGRSKERE